MLIRRRAPASPSRHSLPSLPLPPLFSPPYTLAPPHPLPLPWLSVNHLLKGCTGAYVTRATVYRLPAVLAYPLYPETMVGGDMPADFPRHMGVCLEIRSTGGWSAWYAVDRSVGIIVGGPAHEDPTLAYGECIWQSSRQLQIPVDQWWGKVVAGRSGVVFHLGYDPWRLNCQHFAEDVVRACGEEGALRPYMQDPSRCLGASPVWRAAKKGVAAAKWGTGGAAGGVFVGLTTGGWGGALAGLPLAPITLGLSVPLGAALGAAAGSISGLTLGGIAGAAFGWRRT